MSSGLHHPLIRQTHRQILSNISDLVVCNLFDHVDPHAKEEGTRQEHKDKNKNIFNPDDRKRSRNKVIKINKAAEKDQVQKQRGRSWKQTETMKRLEQEDHQELTVWSWSL